ncbi:hypothetical protein [Mesorhizobium sp. SARCC-RB16n]|uniref:hypothetical protein n=1 Tax=Mesorhizobium sp. SARCC-RB16n TaxID=2116687 RepID=UPI001665B852|nr:hypothetical protein [Mesorhizobium sp. SARCC-RB16n]
MVSQGGREQSRPFFVRFIPQPPSLTKEGMIFAKPIFEREKPAKIAIFREIAVKRFR